MNEKLEKYQSKMEKTMDSLDAELAGIRAGRANPNVLNKIIRRTSLYLDDAFAHSPLCLVTVQNGAITAVWAIVDMGLFVGIVRAHLTIFI